MSEFPTDPYSQMISYQMPEGGSSSKRRPSLDSTSAEVVVVPNSTRPIILVTHDSDVQSPPSSLRLRKQPSRSSLASQASQPPPPVPHTMSRSASSMIAPGAEGIPDPQKVFFIDNDQFRILMRAQKGTHSVLWWNSMWNFLILLVVSVMAGVAIVTLLEARQTIQTASPIVVDVLASTSVVLNNAISGNLTEQVQVSLDVMSRFLLQATDIMASGRFMMSWPTGQSAALPSNTDD